MRLIVTNFNPRFTGVSATIAALLPLQDASHELYLCGKPIEGCQRPVSVRAAIRLSRYDGPVVWHVRRNFEMLTTLFVRDVLRIPIKIVFTSAAIRFHSAFPRFLISRMDAVVATSEQAAGFVPNVVATIAHGVNLARFKPARDRAAAWAETGFGGKGGFITVGRVRPEKGTDVFVDAMIALLPQLPDFYAVIIGKTAREHASFERELRARIERAGLSERIIFAGEVGPTRMPLIMSGASLLFALPRYEGFGLTVVEAMACGTPVIASDAGYFRTFVAGSHAGRIVPIADAEAPVLAAQTILDHPDAYQAAVDDCVARASQFSVATEADALAQVYHDVTRRRS